MEVELATHRAVVGMTFCTGYRSGVQDVSAVSLAHNDIVYEVLMFRPRVHVCCPETDFLLEDEAVDS